MMRQLTLPNGLRLIAQERRTVPLVTVWSWYRVGSGDEVPGTTGITHLCEHMNFKTSASFPREGEFDAFLSAWGGQVNGYTWLDTVAHYSVVVSAGLDAALAAEAERMHAMRYDTASIETECGVVIAEYEGSRNQPESLLGEAVQMAAFAVHGYRWPTIGAIADLRTVTADAVRTHYLRFFRPDNATLVVVGDFAWKDLVAKVRRRFGGIPASTLERPTRTAEPSQHGVRRVDVRHVGSVPYVSYALHTPAAEHRDCAAVIMLRGLLAGGDSLGFGHGSYGATRRSSRLYRALVETGLASRAKAFFIPTRDPFLLWVTAALHRAADAERAERAFFKTLRELAVKGPGARELERVKQQFRVAFAEDEEAIDSVADGLGYFSSIASPSLWRKLLRSVLKQDPEDVRRVAAAYGTIDNATIGRFLPSGEPPFPAPWERLPPPRTAPPPKKSAPRLPPVRADALPAFAVTARRFDLSNGLALLWCRSQAARTVTARLIMPAGSALQDDEDGVAELAARASVEETTSLSAPRLRALQDSAGVLIDPFTSPDAAVLEVTLVPDALPAVLPLLFSIASEPAFPPGKLADEHRRLASERESMLEDTSAVAERRIAELLYRDHPYRFHALGPDEGFPLRRARLLRFWRRTWRPGGSTLLVCGKVSPSELLPLAERYARGWTGEAAAPPSAPPRRRAARTLRARLPGKAQADICLGRLLPERRARAYPALRLLDGVLGHIVLMGRLGTRLRTQTGLAYYAYSRIEALRLSSHLTVHAGVNPAHVERALEEIRGVIRTLGEGGVTGRELGLAKAGIVSDVAARTQTSSGLCSLLTPVAASGLPLDYMAEYVEKIKGARKRDVDEAAAEFLDPDDFCAVAAGP